MRWRLPAAPGVAGAALVALLVLAQPAAAQVPELPGTPLVVYHTYPTLTHDLERLAAERPDIARLSSIGRSVLGLELWTLEVGNLSDPAYADKPGFYLDGGHHGNEHLGVEAAYRFAAWLVEGHGTDPAATAIVEQYRVAVTPLLNPDGKTLNTRQNANLVNLNRNYPWHWDERGTGAFGEGNYAGPSAASEPETRANMAFIEAFRPLVYVSLHTGSYDIVRPFGHAPDDPVPDEDLYQGLFAWAAAETGLESRWPGGSGESICWAYGAQGVFSVLLEVWEPEVRPGGTPQVLLGPLLEDDVDRALGPHLALMAHLAANTPKWGAYLTAALEAAEDSSATLVVRNEGLAAARNVTFAATGAALLGALPAELAPGQEVRVPVRLEGPSHVRLTYERLAVPTEDPAARLAAADALLELRTAGAGDLRAAPGFELVALLAALGAGTVALRRRGA